MKKFIFGFLLLSSFFFVFALKTWAFCPLCIATTGVGIELLRYLGVDDSIVGIWLGAFSLSVVIWLSGITSKKIRNGILRFIIFFVLIYGSNIWLVEWMGFFKNQFNTIFGVNKIILGTVTGSVIVAVSFFVDKYIRSKNNGKVLIYYQKLIIPVSLLLVSSAIFYIIIYGI